MKSGMLAAEVAFDALAGGDPPVELTAYGEAFEKSWVREELWQARNVRPSFKWGLIGGTLYSGLDQVLLRGRAPWTLSHGHLDNETLTKASKAKRIDYPKPDGGGTRSEEHTAELP